MPDRLGRFGWHTSARAESISQRVSPSTSGKAFGRSPYTSLVDVNTNGDVGAWRRAASSIASVPTAFTPKSVPRSRAAQSRDGCAAA